MAADPLHIDADSDPTCHFDTDSDPTCHFDADPVPNFTSMLILIWLLIKVMRICIHSQSLHY
jgi:hypothetical protein